MAASNPLRWPEFEQLGRDFFDVVKPALEQLAGGATALDAEAQASLSQLSIWLDAPCVATVKLDGTNVGVDDTGLIAGRNCVVERGQSYQKVDVWALLSGYAEKSAQFKKALQAAAESDVIAQAMLYGELVTNGKYDYNKAGIYKGWLCFGAVLRPDAEDEDASDRLSAKLRLSGFNTAANKGRVVVAPNATLASLLQGLGVAAVWSGYRPAMAGTAMEWAAHDGSGDLPYFKSLRALLASEWLGRFLLPRAGQALGEGLVVASEAGRLFKLKHGGEELGKVPEQLHEAVEALRRLEGKQPAMELLPPGLLEVFERLLLVATTKPPPLVGEAKEPKPKAEDHEALAVLESALTKFEDLDEVFARGPEAKKAREGDLVEQVARDLVKDYGADKQAATQRAQKVVVRLVGVRFGAWKKAQSAAQ